MPNLILFFLLTSAIVILISIWIITAPKHYKDNPKKMLKKSFFLRISLLIISITVTIWTAFNAPLPKTGNEIFLEIIGVILFIAGASLCVWAKFTMKEVWGMPGEHDTKGQNTLITEGPFKLTRNPIYLGLMLLFVGYSRALHSPAIVLCIPYYFLFRSFIHQEEALLLTIFGKKYEEYKKKVPRWIKMY